ncbi:MAG: hypothetical protein HC898_11290 [Phycisphaerales bacterium]|nr:hypothetical protein [Phycisphaerales bacterium]
MRTFKLALQMYEQVRPKQGKQMMQELIVKGQMDQVVEYMAAMQLRKAAAILKEFKTPPEVAMATELVQTFGRKPWGGPAHIDVGNGSSRCIGATSRWTRPDR